MRAAILLTSIGVACSSNGSASDAGGGDTDDAGSSSDASGENDADALGCFVNPADVVDGDYLHNTYGLEYLARPRQWPRTIALLDERIFWSESWGRGVHSVDLDGCNPASASDMARVYSVATDGVSLFWQADGALYSYRPSDGIARRVDSRDFWDSSYVSGTTEHFAVSGTACVLFARPKTGGDWRTVTATLTGTGVGAAARGNTIYFACMDPGAIYAYDAPTGQIDTLIERPRTIHGLTTTSTSVIWGEDACEPGSCPFFRVNDPGCCPGRILEFDLVTGRTATIAEDPVSRPYHLAIDGGWIYWSNLTQIHRLRRGEVRSATVAESQAKVLNIVFHADYIYWANSLMFGDVAPLEGVLVRAPRR